MCWRGRDGEDISGMGAGNGERLKILFRLRVG
jgi:hypothetical protein